MPSRLIPATRGATLPEYALLLTLVGSLSTMGALIAIPKMSQPLTSARQNLTGGKVVADKTADCFQSEENPVLRLGADTPHRCFILNRQTQQMVLDKPGELSVDATGGQKQLRLTGGGIHQVTLTDTTASSIHSDGQLALDANGGSGRVVVEGTGESEVSVAATARDTWSLSLGDGPNSADIHGAQISTLDAGSGNDTLMLTNPTFGTHSTIDLGGGRNTLAISCPRNHLAGFPPQTTSQGSDTVLIDRCPLSYEGSALASGTDPGPFVVRAKSPAHFLRMSRTGAYLRADAIIEAGEHTEIVLDTQHGIQQGPIDVSLRMNTTEDSSQRASVALAPAITQSHGTPPANHPVRVQIDPDQASGTAHILAAFPTQRYTLDIEPGAQAKAEITLLFGDPDVMPHQGVPEIEMEGGHLDILLPQSITGGCWKATILAKPNQGRASLVQDGGTPPCRYTWPALLDKDLGAYEGLRLDSPNGKTALMMGFNAGPWRNGSTLRPARLTVGTLTVQTPQEKR